MKNKTCSKCDTKKHINNFGNKNNICYDCTKKYQKQYRENNKEQIKKINKEWRLKNKELIKEKGEEYYLENKLKMKERHKEWAKKNLKKIRSSWLRRRFSITLDEYESILKKQNGVCAICLSQETLFDEKRNAIRSLAVDHDHKNGNIRGLLCSNCNKGLGFFKDSEDNLLKAVEYLKRSKP